MKSHPRKISILKKAPVRGFFVFKPISFFLKRVTLVQAVTSFAVVLHGPLRIGAPGATPAGLSNFGVHPVAVRAGAPGLQVTALQVVFTGDRVNGFFVNFLPSFVARRTTQHAPQSCDHQKRPQKPGPSIKFFFYCTNSQFSFDPSFCPTVAFFAPSAFSSEPCSVGWFFFFSVDGVRPQGSGTVFLNTGIDSFLDLCSYRCV